MKTMDDKKKTAPDPDLRPLGNESPDPFSPTLPPGSLHEILRQEDEEEPGDDPERPSKEEAD